MNSMVEYAIKSGISLLVLYLFYWLFLQKDTNFRLNRVVLLFSIIISMAIPVIAPNIIKIRPVFVNLPSLAIDFDSQVEPLTYGLTADPADDGTHIYSGSATEAGIDPASATASHKYNLKIILIGYLAGVFLVFARLIYQAIFLHAVSRLSKKTRLGGFTIVSMSTDMVPFSYFNRIYIPATRIEEGSFDSIIAHEKSHLIQGHYVDLFVIEIITVLQWFNPIVWFYEKSIKEVHEYLADEAVLNTGQNRGRYQALLVNQAIGGPVFILTNQFNQSLIKKRITMMKKMKTSRAAQFKALLIVPLIAGLLLAFASPQSESQSTTGGQKQTITGSVTDRSSGKFLPGSAIVIKGTTIGTLTDAEGNYRIDVDNSDAVLVFSVVGYRTQLVPVGTYTKINVQMEHDVLAIDFSQGNKLVMKENQSGTRPKENDANKNEDQNYVFVEELPGYPGGTDALQKFLASNLKYPEDAKTKGIFGKVIVNYVIDANGMVTNAKIQRGVSADLDKEALRLTNSIKGWKPATQNGRPIPMAVTMPIVFRLNN